eukprot:g7624.t1
MQERYPEKKEDFESFINKDSQLDITWIQSAYLEYHKEVAFENLTEEQRRALAKELSDQRSKLHINALEREAMRLNCDISDVQRTCSVHALEPGSGAEFRLADLPNDVFLKIMHRLNTVDIFRMTLVCRKWKQLVYNNSDALKRAEHALSTHVITFPGWTEGTRFGTVEDLESEYQAFSFGLIQWCSGISSCLETLILDHPVSHQSVRFIIRLCPKLKNLQIGYNLNDIYERSPPNNSFPIVKLPKLECFISSSVDAWHVGQQFYPKLSIDVLRSSTSLKVFGGSLECQDFLMINNQCLLKNAFSQLIALELLRFEPYLLGSLSTIEGFLQLKYLGLHSFRIDYGKFKYGSSSLENMKHFLSKLTKLKVLVLDAPNDPEMLDCVIPLLTKMRLNLDYLLLNSINYRLGENFTDEGSLNQTALLEFRTMLISNRQGLDLSEFYFWLVNANGAENFQAVFPECTILNANRNCSGIHYESQLNHPAMKRRLGIEF